MTDILPLSSEHVSLNDPDLIVMFDTSDGVGDDLPDLQIWTAHRIYLYAQWNQQMWSNKQLLLIYTLQDEKIFRMFSV